MDDNLRKLLAGYIDGELTDEERSAFDEELASNAELRRELEEFESLKEVTGRMTYADLPDEVWDTYWQSIYKKVERGLGWVLLSVGVILIGCFGLYELFYALFTDPTAPLWLKIGLPAAAAGGVILLVSFARERLFAYKRERYREVTK